MDNQSEELKLWKKINLLSDKLCQSADHLHSPEALKKYHSLTLCQMKTVKAVKRLTQSIPEGISLKKLSEELKISPAATSEVVNILVNNEHLVREQSPTDRRAVRIKLSDITVNAINKVFIHFDMKINELINEVSEKDVIIFEKVLDKFLEKIEE